MELFGYMVLGGLTGALIGFIAAKIAIAFGMFD